MSYILNYSIITKKIIDLLVGFIRTQARGSRLYQQTQVTDRFSLEAARLPSIIVRNVSNTQRRTHSDDFIDDIYGRVELVPMLADDNLVGNDLQRTNLADSLDYDPRWPLDPSIGYPSGTDITNVIYTTVSGGTFGSGVTTGMIITIPPPNSFEPSSLIWALENPRLDGTTNPITAQGGTVNSTGMFAEGYANTNYAQTLSGTSIQISLINQNVFPYTGINAVYSGNNTGTGVFPTTGVGVNGAGWFQSGTTLLWSNGGYVDFSGASAAGQVPMSGATYWVDYSYSGPDIHTIAVALSADQEQFYLIYSGISLPNGATAIQAVSPDQFIVNASGLVPGLSGVSIKLNDVLWAGDQYQVQTWNTDQLTYATYGGIYDTSINFECYAGSTIEAQELGDLVERFLVERKKNPYDSAGFNLTSWAQGGQSEQEYINDHIFSTAVSCEGFIWWTDYRGADVITSASGTAIPTGIFVVSGQYIAPGVLTSVNYTNPTYYGGFYNLNGSNPLNNP